MLHLAISLLTFAVTVVIHILWCRNIRKRDALPIASIFIFPLGLIVLAIVVLGLLTIIDPLPLTSILTYTMLSVLYVIYTAGVFMKEGSPTGEIYLVIKKNRRATYREIVDRFDNRVLIGRRLAMLADLGLIKRKRNRFVITQKGIIMDKAMQSMRIVLGSRLGG